MTTDDSRRTWSRGQYVLCLVPVLGLLLIVTDPPWWLQVPVLLVMLGLVALGVNLMSRRGDGWRPSDTLTPPGTDDRDQ